MPPHSRSRLTAGLLALLALAALSWLSIASVAPPAALAADAPAAEFSANRAFTHVQRVGSQVHVAGSAAAAEVGDYIFDTLTDIGLQPRFQDAVGSGGALSGPFGMAQVRNVIAVIPGTASTGRLFLVAHYDSVQVSYGGNDDGAGVSTLLETARALRAGPPPVNDVVLLFTDAEEACLCGAAAFVSQDPLAEQGGVALNVESRGSGGPVIMFETTRGNADVVAVYGAAAPYPVATSFAAEVYRILPNDTDFTPFRDSGDFAGLNSAYIDGSAVYHSPQDQPATMDLRSLQQHGANTLALARAFGTADIGTLSGPGSGDATYFPVFGGLLRYPGALVWPLALAAVVAVAGLAVLTRGRALRGADDRRDGDRSERTEHGDGQRTQLVGRSAAAGGHPPISWPRIAAGFAAALIPLVLSVVAAQLFWTLLVALRPGYANMDDPWWPGWFRACIVALVATILLAWYGLLRRSIGGGSLAIGGLGWLAVIGVALAVVAPGGSYLAALPALAGSIAGMLALVMPAWWLRTVARTLGAAVAVLVLAPTVYLFFPALGLATGAAAALFAALLGLALLPVLELLYPPPATAVAAGPAVGNTVGQQPVSRHRWWTAAPAIGSGALVIAFLAAGLAVDHFDAEHPAPAQLAYAMDADTGQATWVSTDPQPGEWLSRYVSGTTDLSGEFGLFDRPVSTGPAQAADLPAPRVDVVDDRTDAGHRSVTLSITSQRAARLIYFDLPGSVVLRATVQGRPVPFEELGGQFGVVFHAPPPDGLTVELELESAGPLSLRVMDGTDGLDGLPGFTPRPVGVGIQGSHTSELVVVATTVDR